MWTDARQATAWAIAWLLLVTAGFVLLRRPSPNPSRAEGNRAGNPSREEGNRIGWLAILMLAALARLAPAVWLPVGAGYDIDSFHMVTDALLGGQEVYAASLGRHPYLPFQMFIMGAMAALSAATGLPFVVAIKLPAILADVAITGLLYRLVAERRGRDWAAYVALLYALNPVSLLVSAYHGQFEAVTLLLLIMAWALWERRREGASAAALGLAILNKTWPVVLLPVFFIRLANWRARILYALVALGIPALAVGVYLLVYHADPMTMLGRALTHRGVAGYWGPSAVVFPLATAWPVLQPLADVLLALRNPLLLVAILLVLWWTRRQTALDALLTVQLAIFAVTVGFGIQWLVWPVPFALLAGQSRWLRAYSLAATLMLAVHLFGLHMVPWLPERLPASADWIIRLSALPAWGVVVAWLVARLRAAPAGWRRKDWPTSREVAEP